jgi:hypothetical protein
MCHPACSYVFVDSNQITGGRNTPGDKSESPRPPQRPLNDSPLNPEVSLRSSSCPVAPTAFKRSPGSWRKFLPLRQKTKG